MAELEDDAYDTVVNFFMRIQTPVTQSVEKDDQLLNLIFSNIGQLEEEIIQAFRRVLKDDQISVNLDW